MKKIDRIKLSVIGIAFLITIQGVSAQHQFSIYGGGGLSTLQYKPSVGDKKMCSIGGQIGVGYSYYFVPDWSIGTGIEFSLYNSETRVGNVRDRFQIATPGGLPANSNFYLESSFENYREKQRAAYLNIPLMLQYQTGGKHKFYAAGGVKFGIPVSSGYDISVNSLIVKGYSDYTGQLYEDMPVHGFLTYNDISSSGDLDLKIAYIGALEAGVKWWLADWLSLYTGAYFDYGFNDIRDDVETGHAPSLLNPDYTCNSLLQSQNEGKSIVDKVYPVSAGLKIKLSFGREKDIPEIRVYKEPEYILPPTLPVEQEETVEIAPEAELIPVPVFKLKLTAEERQELTAPVIGYNIGESALSPQAKSMIDRKVELLKKYPDENIVVEGHTCDKGGDAINEKVGSERAEKIKIHMVENGIAPVRIQTVSKKSCCPIVPNTNETNRRQNRRVEFKLVE